MRSRYETSLNTIWYLLVRITLVAAVAYVIWQIRSVLITVVLAVMLTYVLLPAVNFICSRRFVPWKGRGIRLAATVLVFVVFFAVVGISVRLMITPFVHEATNFAKSINDYNKDALDVFVQAKEWYTENLPKDWRAFLEKQDFSQMGAGVGGFVSRLVQNTVEWLSNIVELVMIPVLAFYFVLDSRWLKREFIAVVPPWRRREALRLSREVSGILQSYVIGQLILCVLAGIITGVVLHAVNMEYALVLAVLSGVTRAIPIIGPLASGIPICILGGIQSTTLGLWLVLFVTVMHFVESKFIMPILIGDRMKLHPAVILVALLIGAELFGILGMFLAAPIAAIIRELIYSYIVRPRSKRLAEPNMTEDMTSDLLRSETM